MKRPMIRLMLAAWVILIFLNTFNQSKQSVVSWIPIPGSMQRGQGNFILLKTTSIVLSSNQEEVARVVDFLSKKLSAATGFAIPVKTANAASNAPVIIKLSIINNATLAKKGIKPLAVTTI